MFRCWQHESRRVRWLHVFAWPVSAHARSETVSRRKVNGQTRIRTHRSGGATGRWRRCWRGAGDPRCAGIIIGRPITPETGIIRPMADEARRQTLDTRARALRQAVDDLISKAVDNRVKDLLRRGVIFPLDDVQGLFLGDASSRPSSPANETMWLDVAEVTLGGAERQFRSLSDLIDKYGGPEKAQIVG